MARSCDGISPPPAKRRQLSPQNLRTSFKPDSGGHWSPSKDRRPTYPPHSPDNVVQKTRIDRWVPSYRRSSPVERLSSAKRLPSRSPSPPHPPERVRTGLLRHNSDSHATPLYGNLSWKAPHLFALPNNVSTDWKPNQDNADSKGSAMIADGRSSKAEFVKVDFNGLVGVPTGPKKTVAMPRQVQSDFDKSTAPLQIRAIRLLPHLFISYEHLPTLPSTGTHLYRCLRQYVLLQSDICFDRLGWYLSFGNTEEGRERLNACYRERHRSILFKSYILHMEAFPGGCADSADSVLESVERPPDENRVIIQTSAGMPSPKQGGAPSKLPEFTNTLFHNDISSREPSVGQVIAPADKEMPTLRTSLTPDEATLHRIRSSLPLRVPSRPDRDDSSSCISGFTGSDVSSSKRSKCHVCHTNASLETDSLINCTSCPRRYHRRCHTQPPIPLEMDHAHAWQCRRCVKKAVQPKSRLSKSSPEKAATSDPGEVHPEEPPSKKLRIDFSPSPIQAKDSAAALPKTVIAVTTVPLVKEVRRTNPAQTTSKLPQSADRPALDSGEMHLDEADELVAQSFASRPPNPPSGNAPLKLKLVPKKLHQPDRKRLADVVDTEPSLRLIPPDDRFSTQQGQTSTTANADYSPKDNPSRSKDEPHKWASGGADKDIVQTGREMFFPPGGSTHSRDTVSKQSNGAARHAPAVPAPTMEVPESPEEYRQPGMGSLVANSMQSSIVRKEDLNRHVQTTDVSPDQTDGRHMSISGNNTTPQVRRIKPGPTLVGQCRNCGKKIAYNPAGSNELCSRCRLQASVDPSIMTNTQSPFAEGEGFSLALSNPNDRLDVTKTNMRHESETFGMDFSTESTPKVTSKIDGDLSKTAATDSLKTEPPKACESCRRAHKRCDHRDQSTSQQTALEAPVRSNAVGDITGEDNVHDDVLNFWTRNKPSNNRENDQIIAAHAQDESLEEASESESEQSDGEMASNQFRPSAAATTPAPKRVSSRRPATSEYDLGDSFFRPKGSYEKLIGMALCSASGHRLTGPQVVQWVDKNIPGYKLGEGIWANSVRATMTLKKERYDGNPGLWKKIETVAKKGDACEWELMPGQAEQMLHWDPVLGHPVSPPKGWRTTEDTDIDTEMVDADLEHDLGDAVTAATTKLKRRPLKIKLKKRLPRSPSHRNESRSDGEPAEASSEEEPLVRRKRSTFRPPNGEISKIFTEQPSPDAMELDNDTAKRSRPGVQEGSSLDEERARFERSTPSMRVQKPTLVEVIEMDKENLVYSTDNILDTWRDHDFSPSQRQAKIAEIKKRPTRKQRFGKQGRWLEIETRSNHTGEAPHGRHSMNGHSSHRNSFTSFPWQATEDNVIHVNTIEELFNIPKNPIAIIHEGHLAYRDGTRNEDGSLPRAKVVYKTGYT